MSKKILVVLTSVEKYPNLNRATGLWLGEAVHFVKRVEEAGYAVDYVSPEGGYTPIDPHNITLSDGSLLVKGKKATGFSNEEEQTCRTRQVCSFLDGDRISFARRDLQKG